GGRIVLRVLDAERRIAPGAAGPPDVALLDLFGQFEEPLPQVVGPADKIRLDAVRLDVQEAELDQPAAERLDHPRPLFARARAVAVQVDTGNLAAVFGHGEALLRQGQGRHGTGASLAGPGVSGWPTVSLALRLRPARSRCGRTRRSSRRHRSSVRRTRLCRRRA